MGENNLVSMIQEEIETRGWSIRCVGVGPGEYPYAYTVGLARFAVPEMIVFGITDLPTSVDFLNRMSARALQPMLTPNAVYPLVPGSVICDMFQDGFPVAVLQVADSTEHLAITNLLYGDEGPVPAVQLVLADESGRWPWQPESPVFEDLPLLGDIPPHLR